MGTLTFAPCFNGVSEDTGAALWPEIFEYHDDQTKVAALDRDHEVVACLCLQRLFERGLTAGALK